MRNGCSAPSASKEKSFLHSSTSLLYYSVGKKEKGADGKFEAVPVVAAVKAWVAHRLSWRVCGPSAFSYYHHASRSHRAVIKRFHAKVGGGKQKETVFFSLWKKKQGKNPFSVIIFDQQRVSSWPTSLCDSCISSEIIYVPAAAVPNYAHTIWLKMLHTQQKICPFQKIPAVSRPGASPSVLVQMHPTTGRKQTGTANFMGQLRREVNKHVEKSKKKIRLASSHGAVMFHEIHILC